MSEQGPNICDVRSEQMGGQCSEYVVMPVADLDRLQARLAELQRQLADATTAARDHEMAAAEAGALVIGQDGQIEQLVQERKRLLVLLANESHEYEDDYAFSWAAIAYLGFSGNMDAYDEWYDAQVAAGRAEVQGKEARGERGTNQTDNHAIPR